MGPPVKDLTAAPASAAKGHLALPKSRLPLLYSLHLLFADKAISYSTFSPLSSHPIYSLSSSLWHLGGPILIIF